MKPRWHQRWDAVVLMALAGAHLLLSLWLLPSGLLQKYPLFAELVRTGHLSGEEGSPASPLYLLIHVAVPSGAIRWLQCAVALGSMVLLYQVGRRLAGPLTGLISAALFSLSPVVLLYGATLEPDLFLMAACLLGLWAVPLVLGDLKSAVLFGGAMGLAFSLRPTAGLIAGTLLIGLAVERARSGRDRGSWHPLVSALTAMFLVSLASLAGVRTLYSSPAQGTMSPGTAFYDGNRPESIGLGVTNPWLIKITERQAGQGESLPDAAHAIYRQFARLDGGDQMTLGETQAYWAGKSWAFARLEPAAFTSVILRKSVFLLAGSEYHDVETVRRESTALARLPLVRYRWVFWFGLAGMLLAGWLRKLPWWIWGFWASGTATLIFFSVSSRYAMILLPGMILFAAFFIGEAVAVRRWRPAATVALCLILGGLPGLSPSVRWDARVQHRVLQAHTHLDQLMGPRQSMPATMTSYASAMAYFPFLPRIMDTRGIPFESRPLIQDAARASEGLGEESPADAYLQAALWQQAGDCDRALPLARRAAEAGFYTTDYSRSLDPHLLVAECLILAGDSTGAMNAVLASLEGHHATADGLAMAIAGSRATGFSRTRVSGWEERLVLIHDPLSASFALSQALAKWGENDAALELVEWLQGLLPGSAVLDYQAALLHAGGGNADRAFEALQRARQSFPGLALELAPFGETLDVLISSDPHNRQAWMAKVDRSAQAGRFREAFEVATRAEEEFPGDPEILAIRSVLEQLAAQVGG